MRLNATIAANPEVCMRIGRGRGGGKFQLKHKAPHQPEGAPIIQSVGDLAEGGCSQSYRGPDFLGHEVGLLTEIQGD